MPISAGERSMVVFLLRDLYSHVPEFQNNWMEVSASREDEAPQCPLAHGDSFFPHYAFHCDSCPSVWGPSCDCLHAFLSTYHNHRLLPWWAKRDSDSSPLLEQPKDGPRLYKTACWRGSNRTIVPHSWRTGGGDSSQWMTFNFYITVDKFKFYLSWAKRYLSSPGTIYATSCAPHPESTLL